MQPQFRLLDPNFFVSFNITQDSDRASRIVIVFLFFFLSSTCKIFLLEINWEDSSFSLKAMGHRKIYFNYLLSIYVMWT